MKAIVCELCGSNDILKQGDYYVCQHCGTKYTVEEARKLLDTVKIDTSEELNNLYQLARRAKEDGNYDNAQKYYELILLKNPSCWEANFYSVYYKALNCKIGQIASAANSVSNCICSTFKLINDNNTDEQEKQDAVRMVCHDAYYISDLLKAAADNHYKNIDESIRSNYLSENFDNTSAAGLIKKKVCDSLVDLFIDDKEIFTSIAIPYLKKRVEDGYANPGKYVKAIHRYEPEYNGLKINQEKVQDALNYASEAVKELDNKQNQSSKGCYVATAVYGSYDCPQVWTLRRYRDYTLAGTWYGRAFIHTYYAISPTLVKWFGQTEWFKRMWRGKLDRMVAYLKAKGVVDTPYEDRTW